MKYTIPKNPVKWTDIFHDDHAADLSEMYDWIQTGILTCITKNSHAYSFGHGTNTFIVSPSTDADYMYRITCFDRIGPVYHEYYDSIGDLISRGLLGRIHAGKEIIAC